jgi:hypothetical protein
LAGPIFRGDVTYIFLLQSCLEDLVEYGEGLPNRKRIACIFDENNLVRFAARGHYADLMRARNWERLHEEATFKNKRDCVPLQAADMLAYEGYKDCVNLIEGSPRPRRKLLGNLMKSNRIKLAIVDIEGFWNDVEINRTPAVSADFYASGSRTKIILLQLTLMDSERLIGIMHRKRRNLKTMIV